MTELQQFIYNQVIEAQKRFKKEALARVLTEIIYDRIEKDFINNKEL
jgi:hypothetical protein